MVLDGAMGTAIQQEQPDEAGYRGAVRRLADRPAGQQRPAHADRRSRRPDPPQLPRRRCRHHRDNTFNANAISLGDYQMSELAHELNLEAAELAATRRTR